MCVEGRGFMHRIRERTAEESVLLSVITPDGTARITRLPVIEVRLILFLGLIDREGSKVKLGHGTFSKLEFDWSI